MITGLDKIKEKLKKYNQEQLLNNYEKLDEEHKKILLSEIDEIDFEMIEILYRRAKGEIVKENNDNIIEPIDFIEKEQIDLNEKKKIDEIGDSVISQGKYAIVTMAGGQGTRLGHNGPKGTYKLNVEGGKTIFQILCEAIKRQNEKYNISIPWYIMTSNQNNEETVNFFEANNYFGYRKEDIAFFKQGELPVVNEEGKVLLSKEGLINKAADGHGGVFVSIRKNNILDDMKKRGIEWVFISGVDNILAKTVDNTLVGLAKLNNASAAAKSLIKAYPEEKVGVFCKKNGKPSVIEYTEISREMAEKRTSTGELEYAESHILCNMFSIKAVEKISSNKLPYHSAYKKIDYMDEKGNIVISEKPNAYKFEAFLFDSFESLDNLLIMRVKREDEFAPIKNKDGVDSPETAIKLYKDFYGLK